MDFPSTQAIAHRQIEVIRIDLQGLFRLVKGIRHLMLTPSDKFEAGVAGKAMARQMILLTVDGVGVVVHTAHKGKEDG